MTRKDKLRLALKLITGLEIVTRDDFITFGCTRIVHNGTDVREACVDYIVEEIDCEGVLGTQDA